MPILLMGFTAQQKSRHKAAAILAEKNRINGSYTPFGPVGKGSVAAHRSGPHNLDVLCALFGSLLGDCSGTWPKSQLNPYFKFYQSESHSPYLLWIWQFFTSRGYTTGIEPVARTRSNLSVALPRREKGAVVQEYREFSLLTFPSLNWLLHAFYPNYVHGSVGEKVLPSNELLYTYLSPLAIAIWFMDDGT